MDEDLLRSASSQQHHSQHQHQHHHQQQLQQLLAAKQQQEASDPDVNVAVDWDQTDYHEDYVDEEGDLEEEDEEEDDEDDDEDDEDEEESDDYLDIDEMSYEELLALGERIGVHCRGLTPEKIAALPCFPYVQTNDDSINECIICRMDYEAGIHLMKLPCKHSYHADCINSWLLIKKTCPICIAEVQV